MMRRKNDEVERESLVSRSVASIRDSLGPISKELLGRYIFRREHVHPFLARPRISSVLDRYTREKCAGLCIGES